MSNPRSTDPPRSGFAVTRNESTLLAVDAGSHQPIGGVGANFYRPWVFPFYAPSGRTVLQAFPHAHPWHNGIFVAQNPVIHGGRATNFWAVPPHRSREDPIFDHIGRVEVIGEIAAEVLVDGVEFRLRCSWLDTDDREILSERRIVRFLRLPDANVCEVTSSRTACSGDLHFPRTKFGSIGLRVEPMLTPEAGGSILADRDRRGMADVVHEQDSAFIAYEAGFPGSPGGALGVCLTVPGAGVCGPWFIRDFGMAMFNPTWRHAKYLAAGEEWTLSLRVFAYDGPLTVHRLRGWERGLGEGAIAC